MKDYLVSVIIPTFNSEKIGEAIESVLKQTYKKWEMIIVDDGSTDGTKGIIRRYLSLDSRILFFQLKKNSGGPATPRNFGIKKSKGNLIAFLDSDDIWQPEKLEKQVTQFIEDENIALSYCLFQRLSDNSLILKQVYPKKKDRFQGSIFQRIYLKSIIANSGVMVRKNVFDKIGFFDENPKLVAAEDYDMWLRIARINRLAYVDNEPLLLYRVRQESISKNIIGNWKKEMLIAKRYRIYVKKRVFLRKIFMITVGLMRNILFKNIKVRFEKLKISLRGLS